MMVAEIARKDIQKKDPEAMEYIDKLLLVLKEYSHEDLHAFVESSVWADDNKGVFWKQFNTWHYIDLYIYENGDKGLHQDKINIVWAIEQCMSTIKGNLRSM